jgi:hypothetical protein
MKPCRFALWTLIAAGGLLALAAGVSQAQLQTGNLYGQVTDDQGEAVPGVSLTLSGPGATRVQVADAEGQFRFLELAPGSYRLLAELEGYSTVEYPAIVIAVGRNTTIEIQMSPAVEEVI